MASEFRLGWKPLAAATLGVACGASPIPFNVLPIVIGPINADLGWSFLEISAAVTIYGIIGALLAPIIGALVDRHGIKPVALSCQLMTHLINMFQHRLQISRVRNWAIFSSLALTSE